VSVCLSARISQEPHSQSLSNFPCLLPVTVALSSSSDLLIRYVLPSVWMTSGFHIMDPMAECCYRRNDAATIRYDTRCYFNMHSKAARNQRLKSGDKKEEKVKTNMLRSIGNSPGNPWSQSCLIMNGLTPLLCGLVIVLVCPFCCYVMYYFMLFVWRNKLYIVPVSSSLKTNYKKSEKHYKWQPVSKVGGSPYSSKLERTRPTGPVGCFAYAVSW